MKSLGATTYQDFWVRLRSFVLQLTKNPLHPGEAVSVLLELGLDKMRQPVSVLRRLLKDRDIKAAANQMVKSV